MPARQSEQNKQSPKLTTAIHRLETEAETARALLASGGSLTLNDLNLALESLLAVKDFHILSLIFRQLPKAALTQPEIAGALMRFLFLTGNHQQALCIAAEIESHSPDLRNEYFSGLGYRIQQFPPHLTSLSPPEVVDYAFDIEDSHYRMKMALHCSDCDADYIETTGWGIMILRPTCCTRCLTARLLSPDLLITVLQQWHSHDGNSGFRKIDRELHDLVATWHQQTDYPAEGYYRGVNLADLLTLPIQRMLVKNMYKEGYCQPQRRHS